MDSWSYFNGSYKSFSTLKSLQFKLSPNVSSERKIDITIYFKIYKKKIHIHCISCMLVTLFPSQPVLSWNYIRLVITYETSFHGGQLFCAHIIASHCMPTQTRTYIKCIYKYKTIRTSLGNRACRRPHSAPPQCIQRTATDAYTHARSHTTLI